MKKHSVYDIYNDIAKVYDKMSDKNASSLLELIAGKNRSNQISAILQNMSEANELLDKSLNAAGTASAEYQIYLDSAQAATERLGVAMTETYNNIFSGDTIKALANAGTAVLDFANNFGIVEGTLKGFLTLGILKGITTLTIAFKNSAIQVSNYGAALNAVNKLDTVRGTQKYIETMDTLRTSYVGLTNVQLKQVLANKALVESERIAILMERGLTKEQAQAKLVEMGLIQTTNTLAASEGVATTATAGFKNAVKGLGASMKTFVLSHPILITIAAIGATVYGAVKAFDALTVSIDEAIEKTKSSKEELDQLTSEISNLNQELETTKDRIDELLEKANSGTISLLEEKELNNLREQNDELQREIALKEKLAEMDAKEVAENAANSITYRTDDDHWDDEYNATDRIDKLQKYVDSANFYQEKIAEVNQQILDIEESATDSNYKNSSTYKDLIKQQEKYQDELKEAEEQMSSTYKALSVEDDGLYYNGKVIEGYEDLAECLDTVYAAVELYLNDGSIEDTIKEYVETIKNKLIESGLSEEISNAVTEGFSEEELSSIMNASSIDWSVCLGLDDATAVIENIKQQLTSVGNVNITTASFPINEMVNQLNTRLKPAFDSLGSAYQDIFTTDGFNIDAVDIPMLEDLRSTLEDLNEAEDLDISIDMGAFDDFSRILTDTTTTEKEAQQAFDDLATSLFYATSATEGISEETVKLVEQLLESLGVTNAEEVAIYALKDAKAQAILATYDLAEATRDGFAAILDEGEAANLTRQEIYNLTAAEIAFGQNTLSPEQKIQQLRELAIAYNDTTSAALATAIANDLASGHTDVDSAINDLMAKINSGVKKVNLDFSSAGKSSSKSKSSSKKDTTETFDWIEQKIENVEKKVKKLDDVVNSSYSTFSQKNEALAQEIEKVNEDIELQQQAYEKYMQKAESIALSDDYKVLVRDGAINIENISDEKLKTAISDYQKWYDKAISVSDAISDLKVQLKDLHVAGYELNSDRLKELLDSEAITEKQYIEEMTKLYEKFYENQTEYAVQAHEAKMALLEEEKSYLNSVANAAASLLDKEIDKIQDNAKEQEKIYQKQIDILNEKKKPLEDELDSLEDKAKKENLILGLQEKQYNLKKLENQRDKLVYKDDQLIFTTDDSKIRDAQKDVDDAKLELQKYGIQKQIDALDDEIDHINDLIGKVNESADNQIDALEKIKNKWQEVIDQQEEAQNILLLTGEFGTNAIEKILSGNDNDLLAQWKNSYINTLAGIDIESQGYIGNMTEQIAGLYSVDLSPLQTQFQGVKDSVNDMTSALGEAANAIGVGTVQSNITSNQNVPTPSTRTDTSLESAIVNETETAMDSFDQHTDKLTNEVIPAIQAATEEMNTFNEAADMDIEKTVTINYVTTGDKTPKKNILGNAHVEGTVGNAFASGTKNKGLAQNEKNALRSEYGQTEMTVYPDNTYEITNEPVLGDLPKGTVIYNEEQTKKILENKSTPTGSVQSGEAIKEESKFKFGDKMYSDSEFKELVQGFGKLIGVVNPGLIHVQEQMEKRIKSLETNVVNNNQKTQVVNQTITLNCPNLTNNSGIEYIKKELNGLHLRAMQESMKR